jgi:hydroxymethylbilane synthase
VIRVGTRGSALALIQAGAVAEGLRQAGASTTIVPMRTEGDRRQQARLADIGGKGLFVREIEEALAAGDIDVAVHSLKDLPAEVPDGLALGAFPEREDPRDVLVSRQGGGLDALRRGARVGTSSLRRQAQALALRPDLVIEPLRGNVDTRLRKLETSELDAVLLAAAGLIRLGMRPAHATPLPPEQFVPAVGQGVLAVQIRAGDEATRRVVATLDHADTRASATAERAYLGRLGASCNTPMAAHATVSRASGQARLHVRAVVASEDGRRVLRAEAAGAPADAEALGRSLAESLLARGAEAIARLDPARLARAADPSARPAGPRGGERVGR